MVDEMRKAYHDRLAALRDDTIGILRVATASVANATAAWPATDPAASAETGVRAQEAAAHTAKVENDVLDLLAQQQPVARDLRLILASLRIAQIGELCAGLARFLAQRPARADVLAASLRSLVQEIGSRTVALLQKASDAWVGIDTATAIDVIAEAEGCRSAQRAFLAELIGPQEVPIEVGVDLGMTARAYERLTDHAVEIAQRVVFAATGELANGK
jgi:phosphate transport system protein